MKWIDVVTHPLGLVAYTLSLIFGGIGIRLKSENNTWFIPTAITLAALVIGAGLFLAFKDIQSKTKSTNSAPQEKIVVRQVTNGPNSHTIQGVSGNVNIIQNYKKNDK
jgi:hypothetical protein